MEASRQQRRNVARIPSVSDMVLEPHPREFTVDEFHRLAVAGIITTEERVELVNGRLVRMAPIGPPHWDRHAAIVQYLNHALRGNAKVVGQGSFPLGNRSEPQPDVAILAVREYGLEDRPPAANEIFGFIELAESSLAFDVGEKAKLYAKHDIADYLVVDLIQNVLFHYSGPGDLTYGKVDTLGTNVEFRLTSLPEVALASSPFLKTEGAATT